VLGCFIGVDATGNTAFPNSHDGIDVSADEVTIGGTALADRNLVSGNGNTGMVLSMETTTAGLLVIQGNLVGTNAAGSAALPNSVVGVATIGTMFGGSIMVGGSAAGAGNVISGNDGIGLELDGFNPDIVGGFGCGTLSTAQGNLIGTDASGTLPVPNG